MPIIGAVTLMKQGADMTYIHRHLPSPAMVVACLALVVALGGVSYAAGVLPKNSVGAQQLKKAAVTPRTVAPATARLFKGHKGDVGAKGDPGPKGDTGAPGQPGLNGANGATNVVVHTVTSPSAGLSASEVASCPAGERATGGGVHTLESGGGRAVVTASSPDPTTPGATPTEWFGEARNIAGVGTVGVLVHVICASP